MNEYNERLRGTPAPPITLYHGGVSCVKPDGKGQKVYLREPLKRQATKSPGRPGRPLRRSITKYRTNCRQSRSAQLSSEKPFPRARRLSPGHAALPLHMPGSVWRLRALGRGPGTEGNPTVSGEKAGSGERRRQPTPQLCLGERCDLSMPATLLCVLFSSVKCGCQEG